MRQCLRIKRVKVLVLIVVLLVVLCAVFGKKRLLRLSQFKKERDNIEVRIQKLKNENQYLRHELAKIQSADRHYREDMARRELGFVEPGETIYRFDR